MRILSFMGVCLLSLIAASCGNDDFAGEEKETGNGTVTLSASILNDASRLSYDDGGKANGMKVEWSEKDSFTIYRGTDDTKGEAFVNSSGARSTFTGNAPKGTGTYYAVYGGGVKSVGDANLSIDITSQNGAGGENGITAFMMAETDELANGTTLSFKQMMSVLRLNLTLPAEATGKVANVVIRGLHNTAYYGLDISTFIYNDKNKNEIVADNGGEGFEIAGNKILAYVAIFPEYAEAESITITANVGMDSYSYTINNAKMFEAGKITPVNVTLTKTIARENFKDTYTASDYYQWDAYLPYQNGSGDWGPATPWYNPATTTASASCKDCPTPQQAVAYLKAGVYWDNSSDDEGRRTFKSPDGTELHSGLWLKKKHLIPDFYTQSNETLSINVTKMSTLTAEEVKRIRTGGDYFFLPAADYYTDGALSAADAESYQTLYWLRAPYSLGDNKCAFTLRCTSEARCRVYLSLCPNGLIPMVAE